MDLSDHYWQLLAAQLSGFFAADGCFKLTRRTVKGAVTGYRPVAQIGLRDDEFENLQRQCDRYGIGKVRRKPRNGSSQPQAVWEIETATECLRLIEILSVVPIEWKKVLDFEIWKEGVLWIAEHRGGWCQELEDIYLRLRAAKRYGGNAD
jgi:hypothetical protein